MLITKEYNRTRAREYAEKWAYSRNPLFQNYAGIGGDCTNFVSQAVFAGGCIMNPEPVFGWYYSSDSDRAPAWTGVSFFYDFLTRNMGVGPFGREGTDAEMEIGDAVQLFREGEGFYHTLLVVGRDEEGGLLVAAHTNDAFLRPLASYEYDEARFLKILGVRLSVAGFSDCYPALLDGTEIVRNTAFEEIEGGM